ncbi:hypothetical protein MRX96_005525 [Rhipicephalus microplus]
MKRGSNLGVALLNRSSSVDRSLGTATHSYSEDVWDEWRAPNGQRAYGDGWCHAFCHVPLHVSSHGSLKLWMAEFIFLYMNPTDFNVCGELIPTRSPPRTVSTVDAGRRQYA